MRIAGSIVEDRDDFGGRDRIENVRGDWGISGGGDRKFAYSVCWGVGGYV